MQGRHIHEINLPRGQREDEVAAVIPNLSWRYSGGTATNQAITPGLTAGAALVAARSGAAEVVVADGTTGLLVPPGDVDALTAAPEKLMRDPSAAATMGRRTRERAVAEFSLDAKVAGIAKLYSTVRNGGRS